MVGLQLLLYNKILDFLISNFYCSCWGNVGMTSYTRISVGYGCEYHHVMTHEIGHVVNKICIVIGNHRINIINIHNEHNVDTQFFQKNHLSRGLILL